MKYFQFQGGLTLQEPFSVNTPNSGRLATDSHGNPIISASTIRGWLRFASYRSLIEVFMRQAELFSVHEHYMLAKGQDTNNLVSASRATPVGANAAVRKVNPMLDLYGRWGLAGSLGVGNGIAPKSAMVRLANSSRGHITDRFDGLVDFLKEQDIPTLHTIMAEDGEYAPEVRKIRNRLKTANQERKVATGATKAQMAEDMVKIEMELSDLLAQKIGSKETVRRVNFASEVIDAGTCVLQRMKLSSQHQSSLQFFIWTVSKLPFFNIGGLGEYNYGAVLPLWTITEHNFSNIEGSAVGVVGWDESGFVCSLEKEYQFDLGEFEKSLTTNKFNFKCFN